MSCVLNKKLQWLLKGTENYWKPRYNNAISANMIYILINYQECMFFYISQKTPHLMNWYWCKFIWMLTLWRHKFDFLWSMTSEVIEGQIKVIFLSKIHFFLDIFYVWNLILSKFTKDHLFIYKFTFSQIYFVFKSDLTKIW